MDTSGEQVFLFIENQNAGTPYGNLYISDEKGRSFTLSMSNVIKNGQVDFEKINSLDGTFVINRFNREVNAQSTPNIFSEDDLIIEDEKKSRLSQIPFTEESRIAYTDGQKDYSLTVSKQEVQEDMRTYITHNKGAKWELL